MKSPQTQPRAGQYVPELPSGNAGSGIGWLGVARSEPPLAGRRILVTGATGFIGSALCRALASLGAHVSGTTRGLERPVGPAGVDTLHEVDLGRADDCRAVVQRCAPHDIFHLASCVTGARAIRHVGPTFSANLLSTVALMEAAVEFGTRRFVTAGSLEEPEDGAVPSSPYAASKAASRLYADLFAESGELEVVHAKLAMIYGPGQRDVTKLVPYVIRTLLEGDTPRIGSGARLADWTHVDDVIDGFVRLATLTDVPRHVSFGTGRLHSVGDVVDRLVAIDGRGIGACYGAVPDRPNEREAAAVIATASREIDWTPSISLDEGLASTYRIYRALAEASTAPALASAAEPRTVAASPASALSGVDKFASIRHDRGGPVRARGA